jgi:hypothetical protein
MMTKIILFLTIFFIVRKVIVKKLSKKLLSVIEKS